MNRIAAVTASVIHGAHRFKAIQCVTEHHGRGSRMKARREPQSMRSRLFCATRDGAAMQECRVRAAETPDARHDPVRTPILRPGRNCWRAPEAHRVAFFIDAAGYFQALRAALAQARESVLIVGWDFDQNIRLDPQARPGETLGMLIASLVAARPSLRVRILVWGFSTFYGANHQPALSLAERWHARLPRVEFVLDDNYPLGASHHEKIVCIDDALAFVGGIDLTAERWDTQAHDMMNPCRFEYDGEPYLPVHDLQMMVDGDAARSISYLVRRRWLAATGERVSPAVPAGDSWPAGVMPSMEDVIVGIARTRPAYGDDDGVREVEALNVDALRSARETIYLETQYMTAQSIGDVLAARLEEPDGPEVIVVVTRQSNGLVEQFAMGSNRDRLFRRLKAVDRHGRFRAYYAVVPRPDGGEQTVGIHSKLMIVDDSFVRIGSSNFNNRSMGVDTECDLAVEARCDDDSAAIRSLRNRLLAEHLGIEEDALAATVAQSRSVIAAIELLGGGPRRLRPCDIDLAEGTDEPITGTAILDPIEPINLSYLRQVLQMD
jgi:phosphatidylserine/phosphatidylglycerophosphate/cardiolipin synthase-like enzyme